MINVCMLGACAGVCVSVYVPKRSKALRKLPRVNEAEMGRIGRDQSDQRKRRKRRKRGRGREEVEKRKEEEEEEGKQKRKQKSNLGRKENGGRQKERGRK